MSGTALEHGAEKRTQLPMIVCDAWTFMAIRKMRAILREEFLFGQKMAGMRRTWIGSRTRLEIRPSQWLGYGREPGGGFGYAHAVAVLWAEYLTSLCQEPKAHGFVIMIPVGLDGAPTFLLYSPSS